MSHGYAAAFPTFHEANYGQGLVFGLKLFHHGATAWRDIPADLLHNYSDHSSPIGVVLCRSSDVAIWTDMRQRRTDISPGTDLIHQTYALTGGRYLVGSTTPTVPPSPTGLILVTRNPRSGHIRAGNSVINPLSGALKQQPRPAGYIWLQCQQRRYRQIRPWFRGWG